MAKGPLLLFCRVGSDGALLLVLSSSMSVSTPYNEILDDAILGCNYLGCRRASCVVHSW